MTSLSSNWSKGEVVGTVLLSGKGSPLPAGQDTGPQPLAETSPFPKPQGKIQVPSHQPRWRSSTPSFYAGDSSVIPQGLSSCTCPLVMVLARAL